MLKRKCIKCDLHSKYFMQLNEKAFFGSSAPFSLQFEGMFSTARDGKRRNSVLCTKSRHETCFCSELGGKHGLCYFHTTGTHSGQRLAASLPLALGFSWRSPACSHCHRLSHFVPQQVDSIPLQRCEARTARGVPAPARDFAPRGC